MIAESATPGMASHAATLAVAGWMRTRRGIDDSGERSVVQDPPANRTTDGGLVDGLRSIYALFPAAPTDDHGVRIGLVEALDRIDRGGTLAAMHRIAAER